MTILACIIALTGAPCGTPHGGHAHAASPDRGGHAATIYTPLPRLREWTCIHEHEGAWNANTGNGYHGGLQMDWSFMRGYGRDMLAKYRGRGAEAWTPREQIIVADRAYRSGRGFNPWPNTARACGLL